MNNKRFGWLMFALTLGFSTVGAVIYTFFANDILSWGTPKFGRALTVAGFFVIPLVLSMIGAWIAQAIRRRNHSVRRIGSRLFSLLLAVVASGVLSFVSQYLYMIDWGKKDDVVVSRSADIALLIDCSTSMTDCMQTCLDAANELVAQIGENCAVQVIAFSSDIVGTTELTRMNAEGKGKITSYINSLAVVGGTNFDIPLQIAYETMQASTTRNEIQAVILLTDGVSSISSDTKDKYETSGLPVYSVSVIEEDSLSIMRWFLTRFVKSTGGFDTKVYKNAVGDADLAAVVAAFEKAFTSSVQSAGGSYAIVFFGMEGFCFARALIRFLTLLLYAVITQLVFFKRFDTSALISIPAMTVLSFALICLSGLISTSVGLVVSCIAFVLLYWTVYAIYRTVASADNTIRKR